MNNDFLTGAVVMGLASAGLFLLRYWKETRERLFALFAVALFVLCANHILLVILGEPEERTLLAYLVRLLASLLIIAAIIDKNLRRA
jgi:Family of unknown function (DUF5985)